VPSPTVAASPTATPGASPDIEPPSDEALASLPSADDPPPGDEPAADTQDADADADFDWRPFIPADPNDHVARIKLAAAASGCGVPWEVLAAIARVESDFGRNMATSSAGAIGYGQFLPSSWDAFGQQGNAYDYRDALPAIARYLCRHGVAHDPRQAIFAYNHADWYVDLVLGLAARYDHLLPSGPTQDMLDVPEGQSPSLPLHFAAGRDAQAQARSGSQDGVWLPIGFSGRANARATPWDAALAMLQAGFGLDDGPGLDAADLVGLANTAWDAGLDLLGGPGGSHRWSVADVQQSLAAGHPVVALVHARGLPGHAPDEEDVDQPVLLLGTRGDRFVYSDPSFASSLGYGLEISAADLETAWDQASPARRGVAFARRPEAVTYQPSPATPVPTPAPVATPAPPTVTPEPTPLPTEEPQLEDPVPTPEPIRANTPDVELPEPPTVSAAQVAGGVASFSVLGLAALLRRHLPR
jgi:Transglycosylase SLT domain